jgi:hypothetical protein
LSCPFGGVSASRRGWRSRVHGSICVSVIKPRAFPAMVWLSDDTLTTHAHLYRRKGRELKRSHVPGSFCKMQKSRSEKRVAVPPAVPRSCAYDYLIRALANHSEDICSHSLTRQFPLMKLTIMPITLMPHLCLIFSKSMLGAAIYSLYFLVVSSLGYGYALFCGRSAKLVEYGTNALSCECLHRQ